MASAASSFIDGQLEIRYANGESERCRMAMSDVGGGEVCVRVRHPGGETSSHVETWVRNSRDSTLTRVMRGFATAFFGSVRMMPRIVGTPDWREVTLELAISRRHRLFDEARLSLRFDPAGAAGFELQCDGHGVEDSTVTLQREDADALYALARVALASPVLRLDDRLLLKAAGAPAWEDSSPALLGPGVLPGGVGFGEPTVGRFHA
jgi:hypothetical protein